VNLVDLRRIISAHIEASGGETPVTLSIRSICPHCAQTRHADAQIVRVVERDKVIIIEGESK